MTIGGIIKYPLRRLRRYRVGRGFSVHSPFAYYFITRVLRERLPYYCFKSEVRSREERRLFRVVNYFRPSTVALTGSADTSRARKVIINVCPRVEFVDSPARADFTFVASGEIPADFRGAAYGVKASERPDGAMTFTNGHTLIAVRRRGLPSQHFMLSF